MVFKGLNKIICHSCGFKLKIEQTSQFHFIGICLNQKCGKAWFITPAELEGEFYIKPAYKVLDPNEVENHISIGSPEFTFSLVNFKFYNINFFKGADRKPQFGLKPVKITPYIDNVKIEKSKRDGNIRRIKFHFILELKPDVGEINFDGICYLNSSKPERMTFMLKNAKEFMKKVFYNDILKNSYEFAKKIGKKNNQNLPPINFILNHYKKKLN